MARLIYFVLPFVGLVAFGGYYFGVFYKDFAAQEEREAAEKAAKQAKDEAEKKAAEVLAAKEAKERSDAKRAEDEKKEKENEKKQKDEDDKLLKNTTDLEKSVANFSKEKADLEVKLLETRRLREEEQKKVFALAREVELEKINRRNSELEMQLNIEKIAARVEGSSMVEMPILPPPPEQPKTDAKEKEKATR